MAADYSEIVALLGKYFDILHKSDTGLIDQVLLPGAHVYSLADDCDPASLC